VILSFATSVLDVIHLKIRVFSLGADGTPDYGLQMRVWYAISVFVSVHYNRGVPQRVLEVKPPRILTYNL
jgi:hypothetical protein